MRRLRAILRWVLGAVVLLGATLVGILLLLRTDWGRERARRELEARINRVLVGEVSIGTLRGSFPRHVVLQGVKVRDALGRTLVTADQVVVDLDLLPLLFREVHLYRLLVEGPSVTGQRDEWGVLDLQALLPPRRPERKPWRFRLDDVRVQGGTLSIADGRGTTHSFRDMAVLVSVRSGAWGWELVAEHASAFWIERALRVEIKGRFAGTTEKEGRSSVLGARGVTARVDDSFLELPVALFSPTRSRLFGVLNAELVDLPVKGHHAARVVAVRVGRSTPMRAWAIGRLADAEVRMVGHAWPEARRGSARAEVEGFSPSALVAGAPPGNLHGTISTDVAGTALRTLRGTMEINAAGNLAGVRLRHVRIRGEGVGGLVRAQVLVDSDVGRSTAHGELRLLEETVVVEAARARGEVASLTAVFGPRAGGLVGFEVAAQGPLHALAVSGIATGRRVRLGATRAATARIEVSLQGVPSDTRGSVQFLAHEAAYRERSLGKLQATAALWARGSRAVVSLRGGGPPSPHAVASKASIWRESGRIHVRLQELLVTTRSVPWEGRGGTLTWFDDGRLHVRDLVLASRAGHVLVDGLVGWRRGPPSGRAHVHVTGLDLSTFQGALFPESRAAHPLEGTVTVDVLASRQGKELALSADLIGDTIRWRKTAPSTSWLARVRLARGRLSADAQVATPRGGKAEVALDMNAPRAPLELAGWKRLSARDVNHAEVTASDTDLETLAELVGRPATWRGRIDGGIVVGAGGEPASVKIVGRDLQARGIRDLDATVQASISSGVLAAQMSARLSGSPLLTARLGGRVTTDEVLASRGRILRSTPIRGQVDVPGFPLEILRRAGILERQLSGTLVATATLAGPFTSPLIDADVNVHNALIGRVPFRELGARGRIEKEWIDGRLVAQQVSGGQAEAQIRLSRLPLGHASATVVLRSFDLAFLSALGKQVTFLSTAQGTLDGTLNVTGTRMAPRVSGKIQLARGRFTWGGGAQVIEDVHLSARLHEERLVLESLSARSGGGRLAARGSAVLYGLLPRRFSAELQAERLPVNVGRFVAGVDLSAQFSGNRLEETWWVEALVNRGLVRMPRDTHPELQAVGPLEDVIYVDERAVAARQRTLVARERAQARAPIARVHVSVPRGVIIRGPEVDALLKADLNLELWRMRTSMTGNVEVIRGTATLFDRRYEIRRGLIALDGSDPPDPRLDLRLVHEFRTATVFLDVAGTLREPALTLSSDPPLYDQAQLLGFVLGSDPDEPALAVQSTKEKALGMTSALLLGQLRRRLAEVLPVDVLRVAIGDAELGATRFEVGKWVMDNLLLGYRYRSSTDERENRNEVTVEYRFLRRWLFEGRYGDRGMGGADLLWTRRY
ncbi:MAG: translocation/assembly module TamB domain-containing protein [Deltaproteobacteria bacterium]|nr:translocation/assembly module TamB domain-containing protein [Deltaproteobacteria bacterium]